MIYHHTPFSEDTSSNAFKVNLEVLGPCGKGIGSITEKGEVDQRK